MHYRIQSHFAENPNLNQSKILTLSRGQYIKDKENVILAGNSGTGKTHLAIALGICACQSKYKVGFYTAAGLDSHSQRTAIHHGP